MLPVVKSLPNLVSIALVRSIQILGLTKLRAFIINMDSAEARS